VLNLIIITALLTALVCLLWMRLVILEAVRLLNLQRHRTQYKQDDQLKTQAEVKAFIERWK
jgi:Tfp pilus assembly protein PilX